MPDQPDRKIATTVLWMDENETVRLIRRQYGQSGIVHYAVEVYQPDFTDRRAWRPLDHRSLPVGWNTAIATLFYALAAEKLPPGEIDSLDEFRTYFV